MKFITRMVQSELVELAQTEYTDKDEAIKFVEKCIGADIRPREIPKDEIEKIADQADALIDIVVYCYDSLVRMGIDGFPLIKAVMDANMAKKSSNGSFIIRPDGKIMKPEGWKPADIKSLVRNQLTND